MRQLILMLLLLSPLSFAEPIVPSDGIWLAIRVQDGEQNTNEYHGWMERKQFWRIINNEKSSGIIRLKNVFWLDTDGNAVPLQSARPNQKDYGYDRDVFFKVENIYRIIPLRDDFVAKLLPEVKGE